MDENVILGQSENPDKSYIEKIMPDKIRYNMKYIDNYSIKEYFKIIFLTVKRIIR
jgi:lipopolysaccharide/colanic/teichoic acid biosynthesis glycosyltransferase